MPGLKGLRSLVVGVAIFLNVGVTPPYADAPRVAGLTAQGQSTPEADYGDLDLKWLSAAPRPEHKVDRPISIRPDRDAANSAVVGNRGEPLDVPANARGSRRFIKVVKAFAVAALPVVARAAGKAVARAIEMGLELVLKSRL